MGILGLHALWWTLNLAGVWFVTRFDHATLGRKISTPTSLGTKNKESAR
jgi:hypothetical protein